MRNLVSLLILVSFSFFANAERKSLVLEDSTVCNFEIEKNVLDGEYKSFFNNGKPKSEGSFSEGKRYGFWVFYKPDGKIQCIRDYKDNFTYEEKSSDNKLKKITEQPQKALLEFAAGNELEINNAITLIEGQNSEISGMLNNN